MQPERMSYINTTKVLMTSVIPEVTTAAESTVKELDTKEITYFVDEEGQYYYQPGQNLVPVPTTDDNSLTEKPVDVEETTATEIEMISTEAYRTATLVPSKNSNEEVTYVIVVQDENLPITNVDIEKPVDVEETTATEIEMISTEAYRTATLVPSKNSNEEVTYVIVVPDENLPITNVDIEKPVDVEETTATEIEMISTEAYRTATLVPSKNSNEEVTYVIVVQDENLPITNVDIEEERPAFEVYKFENKGEASQLEEVPIATPAPTKKKHKRRGVNFICPICKFRSNRRYLLVRHVKTHSEERPHRCEVCERRFKSCATLRNHIRIHNGLKPHLCTYCKSTFTTSAALVRHVRYKHTHEKPHKCTECDYASVELSKLRRHVRCHTGERPYQCSHCTYASPDSFKLKRHLRIHTAEKPYECDVCKMCFNQSNSLKSHKLIIHNASKKPVFACELCPAKCVRKVDLRIHVQKWHTSDHPLTCTRCGESFPNKYSLKIHNKTHNGEKCFKCDVCPYASSSRRTLKTHMLMHTDEKPFSCDACDQCFRQKQLLRRHQNVYHNPQYVPKPPKDKTHTCHECSRTYAYKANLIRHLAVHDPDSGHPQQARALSLGRQKKVLQDESRSKNEKQVLKIDTSSELKRGELLTKNGGDGLQYVVVERIQLEDGSTQYLVARRKDGGGAMLIEEEEDNKVEENDVNNNRVEIEIEMEEVDEEEEDTQTQMKKHIENQEKASAVRSTNLEQDVQAYFGFEEEDTEANEVLQKNVI